MSDALTADDLIPLIAKLPHDEQIRLAKLALRAAAVDHDDATAYLKVPSSSGEFESDDEGLTWDGGGWNGFDAAR